MLDTVVRKLVEFRYERALRQIYLGNAVKVSERQLPELWTSHQGSARILDMPRRPDLYVSGQLVVNAARSAPRTRSSSSDSALLSAARPGEQRVVLAHEIGHILSDHMLT